MSAVVSFEVARNKIDEFVHAGVGRSRPIPVGDTERPGVTFMLYRAHLLESAISEPRGLVTIDMASGSVTREEVFAREAYGLPSPPNPNALGARASARAKPRDAWMLQLHRLDQDAEALAPRFWARAKGIDEREFRALLFYVDHFDELVEEGLGAYYRAVGRDWFGWLNAMRATQGGRG